MTMREVVPQLRRASFLILLLFVFSLGASPQASQEQPNELARRILQNELRVEAQDHSHWMFRLDTENEKGEAEVDEVVETPHGDLKLPISINGAPLTPKERQESEKGLERLVTNPGALEKSRKDQNQDAARSQHLLKMLPDAFIFTYGERRGNLLQLAFRPNLKFRPAGHEEQVFHAMEGSLWVDDHENRLAEISGQLMDEVRFGGGLLGHLDKGGTFDVKQAPVAPGYWEMTLLNVHMNGKALFFKTIAVRQKYSRSNFQRVPDDLTAANGAEMLKKQVSSDQARRP